MKSKQEILKIMGDIPEDVYDDIVVSFYEEARERLKAIKSSIGSNNFEGVAQGAHAIKGSGGNLYLTEIQAAAKSLEDAARAKNTNGVVQCLDQLTRLIP